ncbi:glycosyltransferase family 25 protein [Methylobacterium sp. E-065]|uniref:glycosyltransferase family 25 protein n=1 Tax=Methylobacterium sp. E-065 TaxID=2836583 RepID=UPI001FBB08AE|nr:glycosyltransferase family 25 protein [Methylobacterium sp. E-065]MCJ2019210.1 glycosyltransferase family 25 protein [Methylobacterium sp. E-065]
MDLGIHFRGAGDDILELAASKKSTYCRFIYHGGVSPAIPLRLAPTWIRVSGNSQRTVEYCNHRLEYMVTSMQIEVKIISLKNSFEKRAFLSNNIKFSSSMPWSFFDANTGSDEKSQLVSDHESQRRQFGRCLTKGEIGCFRSHYNLLSQFLSSGSTDWLLVLEDDVWIDSDFDFQELIDLLEKRSIDYIRLFAKMFKPADIVDNLSGFRQIIRFRTDPYGTQAYLINKRGCDAFLKDIQRISIPIDDELGRFWRHKLDPYCVFPFPVVERNTQSSLEKLRNDVLVSRDNSSFVRIRTRISDNLRKRASNVGYRYKKALSLF